jgi:cytochrome P450
MSFLLAGHETTANGLAWTWYEISKRPEIRNHLLDEVDSVIGANLSPSITDIEALKFTSAIFEEAMRLYPPVWTMSRESLEDDVLTLDNGETIEVPKDATVMLCAYGMHRNSKYWRDAEAFDPYRFYDKEEKLRPKFSYFPFGGGARLCLGHKFAMVESVLAIAMIAQRYELTLLSGQDIRPEPIITLRPSNPVMFSVRHRVKSSHSLAHSTYESLTKEDIAEKSCPFARREIPAL